VRRLALAGGLSALVALVGFVKEMLVARYIGATSTLDVFLLSLAVPTFLAMLLGNAFQPIVSKTYLELKKTSPGSAPAFLVRELCLFLKMAAGLAVFTAGVAFFAGPLTDALLPAGRSIDKVQSVRTCMVILSPVTLLLFATSALTTVLNMNGRFLGAGLAPLAIPASLILVCVLGGVHLSTNLLAFATLGGYTLQAITLYVMARRRGLLTAPPAVSVGRPPQWRAGAALIAANIAIACLALVDQYFASRQGAGGVATVNFGFKMVMATSGILGAAFGPVSMHAIAEAIHNEEALHRTLWRLVGLALACSIPVAGLLGGLAEPLIVLVFRHGAFTAEHALSAANLQAWYSLTIPVSIMLIVFGQLTAARGNVKALVLSACARLVAEIVFNYSLAPSMGLSGIAVTNVLSALAGLTALVAGIRFFGTRSALETEPRPLAC
jgi:putative peptidoglycan lipid II flippase